MQKLFALRHKETGRLMGFDASSNEGGDFCTSVQFYLDQQSEFFPRLWVTGDFEAAKEAATTNVDWYNACYETPTNGYVGQLEVVELELTVRPIE